MNIDTTSTTWEDGTTRGSDEMRIVFSVGKYSNSKTYNTSRYTTTTFKEFTCTTSSQANVAYFEGDFTSDVAAGDYFYIPDDTLGTIPFKVDSVVLESSNTKITFIGVKTNFIAGKSYKTNVPKPPTNK